MRMIPLQSGSNGNCVYVEAAGVRLLFDAGLSAEAAEARLRQHQLSLREIDALFITHEHADHIRFAASLARAGGLPVFITPRTYQAAKRRYGLSSLAATPCRDGLGAIRHFEAGEQVRFGPVSVEATATPHDAVDGVVFTVDDGRQRLGLCTDFGHVFSELEALVASVDGLYLESNYDHDRLMNGPYPRPLKTRISGPRGHISNAEAAALVAGAASPRLQWLCLAHLSAKNNSPALALAAHRERLGPELKVVIAKRFAATEPLVLNASLFTPRAADASLPVLPQPSLELASFWGETAAAALHRRSIRRRLVGEPGGFAF